MARTLATPAALLLALLLLAGGSSATLIDLGDVTRDTGSGLDWLDMTESAGLSFEDVAGGAGGFLADGWQIATEAQVCDLFANHAVPPVPCPSLTSTTAPGNGNEPIITLFGVTLAGPQSIEFSGVYDNGEPLHGFGFAYYNSVQGYSETAAFDNVVAPPTSEGIGVFLTRPIPEPGTGLLVALGMLGLAARRRARAGA